MTVIGLGTQDNVGMAQQFLTDYGISSFPLLWDETFASWQQLGINGQPAGMLLTSGGEIVAQWAGGISEAEVLAEAAKLP